MSEFHHLIAKLAENLYKFLEGADSFQMVKGYKDLKGRRTSEQCVNLKHMVCVILVHPHCNNLFLIIQEISRKCKNNQEYYMCLYADLTLQSLITFFGKVL